MPYDQSSPGDALAAEPAAEEGQGTGTISVPRETLPDCAAGDTYKVVSADESTVQLERVPGAPEDENEKWADDFRQHMSPRRGGGMSETLEEEMS